MIATLRSRARKVQTTVKEGLVGGFAASLSDVISREWPVCFVGMPVAVSTASLYALVPGLDGTTSAEVFWCLVACSTLGLSHGALDALLMFRLEGGTYRVALLLAYL